MNTTFFSPNSFLFKESELNDTELVENIHRFKHEAVEVLFNKDFRWHSVKEYFEEKGYSQKFLSKYLYPRIQGLFFYPPEGLENLPVSFVMNFYSLQCGFKYNENPSSSRFNFKNGASSWIENLAKSIPSQNIIKSESPKIVKSEKGFKIYYSNGEVLVDKLVFACHADDLCRQYAAILSEKQYQILSKIKYAKMQAVAHFDINYLPVKKTDFSAYNCLVKDVSEDKNNIYFVGGYTNGIGLHENSLW